VGGRRGRRKFDIPLLDAINRLNGQQKTVKTIFSSPELIPTITRKKMKKKFWTENLKKKGKGYPWLFSIFWPNIFLWDLYFNDCI